MATNNYYTRFASILSIINENAISSSDKLKEPCNETLYAELWLAVQDFINYFALCSKSHRNAKGERVEGNADKVKALISRGVELEDIRGNILTHVLRKMDNILSQPAEKQINYTYHMINNCVYNEFRKLPPASIVVVNLQDKVKMNNHSAEDISELQDFICDPNTLEDEIVAMETVDEILKAKRKEVLDEISHLANKPAEVFARLCSKHLGMKPASIAKLLLEKGAVTSFATVLILASNEFDIPIDEICSHLTNKTIAPKSVKLDSNDESQISAQISRLIYRAGKRLDKDTDGDEDE